MREREGRCGTAEPCARIAWYKNWEFELFFFGPFSISFSLTPLQVVAFFCVPPTISCLPFVPVICFFLNQFSLSLFIVYYLLDTISLLGNPLSPLVFGTPTVQHFTCTSKASVLPLVLFPAVLCPVLFPMTFIPVLFPCSLTSVADPHHVDADPDHASFPLSFSPVMSSVLSLCSRQCSGSVSVLASRIHIRYSENRIQILPSSSKNSKTALYFNCFGHSLWPSKSNTQKNLGKFYILLASWRSMTNRIGSRSVSQRYTSADPD